jgi:8-oxo-dGTP pyrophosphatase MutT (NUDIX family)
VAALRDAATVVLVRPAQDGFEAFLLRRIAVLEFAPGASVFPGGSVDPGDADPEIGWTGPSPAEFAAPLGTSAERARALVCAAVRETFEESGVLLAGPGRAGEPAPEELVEDRQALLDGTVSLAQVLTRRGLVVRADLLRPWARWLTPEVSPRRFDTWFFVAALPTGQTAMITEGPGEADHGSWLRPAAALDAARAGRITLLPPTAVTLAELAVHGDLAGVMAAPRTIVPLMPEVIREDGRAWLAMPPGAEYPL